MGRINRQGQTNPVLFHHLISPGSVDELLLEVLNQKEANQTHILGLIKEYANAKTHRR